ncbi:MAG: hypothetical protein ACYC5M_10080 [Anaerolineae bacterium]
MHSYLPPRTLCRSFLVTLGIALLVCLPRSGVAEGRVNPSAPFGGKPALAADAAYRVWLPLIIRPQVFVPLPGASYGTLPVTPQTAPNTRDDDEHPDWNLALRGYVATSAPKQLVQYGDHVDDPNGPPQLAGLYATPRGPVFTTVYRVYNWNWDTNTREGLISTWPVTLAGLASTPGETMHVPESGYHIGSGYEVLVLYATPERITLKYTGEGDVVNGYTVHVEGVWVDPALLALYQACDAAGRGTLPALYPRQAFGRALGHEVGVAIRDCGSFMDPRSRLDWWQGY